MDNILNPGDSPNGLVAVRRLNHIPLYVVGTIAAGVALIIGMVAMDKSKEAAARPEDHGGSTDSYAAQAAGERTGYIPAFRTPTPWPMTTPPVTTSTPMPTPDTTEADARKKAFFQALYATSAVQGEAASAPTSVQVQMPPAPPSLPYGDMGQLVPSPSATPNPNALSTYDGSRDRWTLNNRREMPTTPYLLRTGWVIPALMISGMESQLPGAVIAQVSQDVYDSGTGTHLLIPQGSRIMGEYSNAIQYGQDRIFIAWQRLIFPDNSALDIGAMPGTDQQGEAGAHDLTNNHFLRTFGSAILMSAITAGVTISQPQNSNSYNGTPSASSALSQALGQQLGSATSALLERNLSIAPTLKIRPGYRFNILVVKDLIFDKPYVVPNYTKR